VITTDHTAFDYRLILEHGRAVVDTRNALRRAVSGEMPAVTRLGASGGPYRAVVAA